MRARGVALLKLVNLIKALEEERRCDLLDNIHGVGNAARPEGTPDAVYLVAEVTCKHAITLSTRRCTCALVAVYG